MSLADEVVVGTAGHIDHGKTALVRGLTGVDTDRLPEEKRRGITIDLGFAHMDVAAGWGPGGSSSAGSDAAPGGGQSRAVRVSFVDVPGHHAFVRNMLAGAGGIDGVMLVVSAEEGIKPQTEEHLAICELLGVRRGLAVVTKADAVSGERLAEACAEVREFLRGTLLEGKPVVAASAFTGQGLAEVKRALGEMAGAVAGRDGGGVVRLPVDRAFAMRGFGTVVTGTLHAGVIRRGDGLVAEPSGRKVRVRGVQRHGKAVEEAAAGSRVALNLTGVEVGEIGRGETLVAAGGARAVSTVDVEIRLLAGAPGLRHGAEVRLHAFTAETGARVLLYEGGAMEAGGTALAGLRLSEPMVLVPGDRFVIRQPSLGTIGGGRVVDGHRVARLRKADRLAWLQRLRGANGEEVLRLRVGRRGMAGIAVEALAAEMGWTREAVEKGLKGEAGVVRAGNGLLVSPEAMASAMRVVAEQAHGAGGRDASGVGLKRSELRSRTGLGEAVFEAALGRLVGEKKLAMAGELVRPFAAASGEKDRAAMEAVARVYAEAGLNPPLPREVAPRLRLGDGEMRRLMTLLLREKRLVKVGAEDLYVHEAALAELKTRVRGLKGQKLDVGRFKELTGLTRKMAIPLLEYLDREMVTRRVGDARLVV